MVDLDELDRLHAALPATCGELAALRALAEVVKVHCDWAHPNWAPEIREALALVEKARTL